MTTNLTTDTISLKKFSEKSYLDYSMYVILDRALPFIGDGLKPVQRRIIYAMSELSLSATAKFKKSARTVGDVIGKFHPHGDSAAYEAMVLMAQSFSYRYPLIDGQGNWGSVDDPKSFAAMRYTESKLTAYADLLLSELKLEAIDWRNNFDGTLQEPIHLPARLPNILLNGVSGIAVGMSTDIPPHNLSEVANACIFLLKNKKACLEDLMQFIQAPDFPTTAEIISPKNDILNIYQTGKGSIKMRANWSQEKGQIIIHALPHQTSGSKIIEQIAAQMRDKKLPMIDDLRDESDHKQPIRLVIIPRSNRVDVKQMMLHLFATTDLEKNIRVNFNVIGLDGKPQTKPLLLLLREWLIFRTNTVKRRLNARLVKLLEHLHILDGLLIAYLNIDEVIKIIRKFDNPKVELINRFNLSELQAKSILDLRLRQLAKLEEIKIKGEQTKLNQERQKIELVLSSEIRLKNLIEKEIKADAKQFGDSRKSLLKTRTESMAIDPKSLIPSELITVILSQKGWIRAAKGHDINPLDMSYKSGDGFLAFSKGTNRQNTAIVDSTGRVYTLENGSLPSARGQGEPLTGKLSPAPNINFCDLYTGSSDDLLLVASDVGYGFISKFANLYSRGKSGKAFLRMPEYAQFLSFQIIQNLDTDYLVALSNEGRLLTFKVSELPELSKGKGNKIIGINPQKAKKRTELLTNILVVGANANLKIIAGKRYLKLSMKDLEPYHGARGSRGKLLPRGFQRADALELID